MSNTIDQQDDRNDTQTQEINVTPLADVSLTLLIAIMMLTPLVMQAMITVNTGAVRSFPAQRVAAEHQPVFIDIGEDVLFLNDELIEDDAVFVEKLAGLLKHNPDPSVLITASPAARHGRIVQVLDAAKMNGAQKLSIVPRKKT